MALTVNDVASLLMVPVETVLRWIRQGKIPMQRRGDAYTIRIEMLERWAKEHNFEIHRPSDTRAGQGRIDPEFDTILLAMHRGGVFYNVEGNNCEKALKSVVRQIPNIDPAESDLIYEKLLERERLASTGIGHGIALPHPRSNPDISLKMPQITTCFLTHAIPFDAIDGLPVSVLMVLLSRSTKQHLAMLSKLSFFLRDPAFRDYLLTKPDQAEIFDKIEGLESR